MPGHPVTCRPAQPLSWSDPPADTTMALATKVGESVRSHPVMKGDWAVVMDLSGLTDSDEDCPFSSSPASSPPTAQRKPSFSFTSPDETPLSVEESPVVGWPSCFDDIMAASAPRKVGPSEEVPKRRRPGSAPHQGDETPKRGRKSGPDEGMDAHCAQDDLGKEVQPLSKAELVGGHKPRKVGRPQAAPKAAPKAKAASKAAVQKKPSMKVIKEKSATGKGAKDLSFEISAKLKTRSGATCLGLCTCSVPLCPRQ